MDWDNEDFCEGFEFEEDEEVYKLGKYYWRTEKGRLIKVDDLEKSHIENIVVMFGTSQLKKKGYQNIVDRFYEIKKEVK